MAGSFALRCDKGPTRRLGVDTWGPGYRRGGGEYEHTFARGSDTEMELPS
jgi:hypothetical protein